MIAVTDCINAIDTAVGDRQIALAPAALSGFSSGFEFRNRKLSGAIVNKAKIAHWPSENRQPAASVTGTATKEAMVAEMAVKVR